jgi:hypothetical protein
VNAGRPVMRVWRDLYAAQITSSGPLPQAVPGVSRKAIDEDNPSDFAH